VASGDGPRHFVFHPTLPIAYSGCELKSQVQVREEAAIRQRASSGSVRSKQRAKRCTTRPHWLLGCEPRIWLLHVWKVCRPASALLSSPPCPQVFAVDASNPDEVRPRITPIQRLSTLPEGWSSTNYVGEIKIDADGRHVYVSNRGHHSIATFSVDAATGLLTREGIDSTLGDCPRHFGLSPCGGYAVVGDQDSDVVKVFTLCPDTGRLVTCIQELETPTPNFVLFARPHPLGAAKISTGASEAREQARTVSNIRVASPVAVCAS
jgi:6-phosphogluconolactonase (cycloisomerase 2 family)